jgi:hypothetical protein
MQTLDPAYAYAVGLVAAMEEGDAEGERRLRDRLANTTATSRSGRMAQAVEARGMANEIIFTLADAIVEAGLADKARALVLLLEQIDASA